MPNKETQKFVLAISACFAVALVAVAFLFSSFLDWRAQTAQYGRDFPGLKSTGENPCSPTVAAHDKRATQPNYEEELTPLDPGQEEILAAGGALAPAEVLGLTESIENLKSVQTKPEAVKLQWDKVDGAKAYHVQAWQMKTDGKLMLVDEKVKDTQLRLERKISGDIYWQVAAIDDAGKTGEVAGPTVIRDRKPATHQD